MKKILILLLLLEGGLSFAQDTDDVYINSELFPSADIGSVVKLKAGIDIPLLNTSKDKFTIGGKIQNSTFNFVDKNVPFETDQIESFNSFSLKFKYQRRLVNDWAINLMAESQISSNFDDNSISTNDIFINGLITLEKFNEEENSKWTFGATYDIQYGLYHPIPIVTYTKRISDAWAYKLGVPDSRVKLSLSENHDFEGFATLTGFTGNINDDIDVYKEDYTGTLRQTSVLVGLGYNYTLWNKFKASVNGGYSLYNRMQIQDYDNEEIYDFDISNSFYLNLGLKYIFKNNTEIKSLY